MSSSLALGAQSSPLLQPFSAITNLFKAKTQQAERDLRRHQRQRRLRRLRRLRNLQRNLRRGRRRPQRRRQSRRHNSSRLARLEEIRSQRTIIFIKNTFFDAVWTALTVIGVKLIPLLLFFVKHLFKLSTPFGLIDSVLADSTEPLDVTDEDFLDIPQRLNVFDRLSTDDDSFFNDNEEDDTFENDNNQNDFQFDSVDNDDIELEEADRSILDKITGLSDDFSVPSNGRFTTIT